MYNYTLHSCCFSYLIPIIVSVRIFEWVLFANDEDNSLVYLICFMIKIQEEDLLAIEDSSMLYRHISKAMFIQRCFEEKELYTKLVTFMKKEFEEKY